MQGKVTNLFVKSAHGRPMQPVQNVNTVSGKGIVGDASYGRSRRQVLLVDKAVLDYYHLHPGDLRENMTIAGLALSELQEGKAIRIGEITLEITGDCKPCDMVNTLKEGLRDEIDGHRGVLAKILTGGEVNIGDPITLSEI